MVTSDATSLRLSWRLSDKMMDLPQPVLSSRTPTPFSVSHVRRRRFKSEGRTAKGTNKAGLTQTTTYSSGGLVGMDDDSSDTSSSSCTDDRRGLLSSTWSDMKDKYTSRESWWWSSHQSDYDHEAEESALVYSTADTIRMSISNKMRHLQEEVNQMGEAKLSLIKEVKDLKGKLEVLKGEYISEVEHSNSLVDDITIYIKKDEEKNRQMRFLMEQCRKLRGVIDQHVEDKKHLQRQLAMERMKPRLEVDSTSGGDSTIDVDVLKQELEMHKAISVKLRGDLIESKATILQLTDRLKDDRKDTRKEVVHCDCSDTSSCSGTEWHPKVKLTIS